jgi:peptidoglycan hydrolase-like protein with peptidoglycan-binding domain
MLRILNTLKHKITPFRVWPLLAAALVCAFVFVEVQPASAHTSNVRLLQRDLAGLDYLPTSGVDGIYGPQTTAAVRHFQKDRCLKVDGDAGNKTMSALQGLVKAVQKKVGTTPDGDYGSETIAAVRRYQVPRHFGGNGIADARTMASLGIPRVRHC